MKKRRGFMTDGELLYLAMVIGAVTAFILVLAYESTTEAKGRDQRQN
ncbi:MAG: quinol-cytochrome oxidoreductase complex cytochrome b subunit [Alphaproteobacteria bacterium]|jgi:quinol-cytochrome oxidoreductase complex cytochrome b subunit